MEPSSLEQPILLLLLLCAIGFLVLFGRGRVPVNFFITVSLVMLNVFRMPSRIYIEWLSGYLSKDKYIE